MYAPTLGTMMTIAGAMLAQKKNEGQIHGTKPNGLVGGTFTDCRSIYLVI
ncbi:hypothetical protein [Acinetobacter sp. B51(2017)]|nr:hypothetical protein [Acinetobacter sp. B51(2017)]